MDAEIRKIHVLYTNALNRLITFANNTIRNINTMRMNNNTKRYYIRYIIRWFNQQKEILNKKRESDIKAIQNNFSQPTLTHGKKALLVGINYVNTSSELRGCVNDVNDLKQLLTAKYNYSRSNIVTLTDSQATKQNVLSQLTKLLKSGNSGDTLFFSFSGHGYFKRDSSNDEEDGKDELLISVDNLAIVDDELKHIIDTHLKANVTLIALVDTCHSGTILDLPYKYYKGQPKLSHNSLSNDTKGTVICVSGCRDDQVSMDAYLEGDFNGAMTFHFVELLNESNSLTWKACIEQLQDKLKKDKFTQVPQMTCGKNIDLNNVYVKL